MALVTALESQAVRAKIFLMFAGESHVGPKIVWEFVLLANGRAVFDSGRAASRFAGVA